jgi:hypothetical protein
MQFRSLAVQITYKPYKFELLHLARLQDDEGVPKCFAAGTGSSYPHSKVAELRENLKNLR